MKTAVQGLIVLGALAATLGCARKPVGEYDPSDFDGLDLPFLPEAGEGAGTGTTGPDSDGDGVGDARELELGLNPDFADSDADGYDDGVELAANSDPLDNSHHPYEGGWAIDACRADLVATGDGIGQVTANFQLTDQYNDQVRLHDFCGREVLLVASGMWCGVCQTEAPGLQEMYDRYEAQGLMVITILGEDSNYEDPTVADLKEWAATYDLKHPVLADPGYNVAFRFIDGYEIGLPSMNQLGPGAVVLTRDGWVSEADIVANLP